MELLVKYCGYAVKWLYGGNSLRLYVSICSFIFVNTVKAIQFVGTIKLFKVVINCVHLYF